MNIIEWIKSIFNKFVRAFKALVKMAVPLVKQIIIGQLKDIALQVVAELAATDLTDEEKRKQALERIKTYAISHGITAKDSIIALVLELAVQAYKEELDG